jgi:hypothetical protein
MSPQDRNEPLVGIEQSAKFSIRHANLTLASHYKPGGKGLQFAGETYQCHMRQTGVTVNSPSARGGSWDELLYHKVERRSPGSLAHRSSSLDG